VSAHAHELGALGDLAYLDHALRGPLPLRAFAATENALLACARGALARPELERSIAAARSNLARLLGAGPSAIAFEKNATEAIAAFARGVDWRPGDRVVTNEGEYPANVTPWRAHADVTVLPLREGRLDLADVDLALRGARVLTVAAVSLATGERRDLARLAELARKHGALFFVDAAQALGVLRLDPSALGIDGLASSSRKWLLGPPEVGILYRRSPAPESPGALAGPLLAGLAASSGWLLEVGPERVEALALARALEVHELARSQGLRVLSPEGSPIVRLEPRQPVTEATLLERGVVARVEASGVVRLSPHFWNPPEHIGHAVAMLAR
jgi:selenocysteine lyase/cysteine desulfurase